jgi:hypothetical protein
MLTSICFGIILLALFLLIENGYFSREIKILITVVTLGGIICFENFNYAFFFFVNWITTFFLSKVKRKNLRVFYYSLACILFFNSDTIGLFLNNTFLTFIFPETSYLNYPIYGLPFIFISIKYLEKPEIIDPKFNINNILKLLLLVILLLTIGNPIVKTFGHIQSLNFFQALFILISSSSIVYIIRRILFLFNISFEKHLERFNDFFILFILIVFINPSLAHTLIGGGLLLNYFKSTSLLKNKLTAINFFLLGMIFLPDFDTIKATILGLLSWSSIFSYYNEFYILYSIGADFMIFIPMLVALIIFNRYQNKSFLNTLNNENRVKLPQLIFTCILLLFIF